MEAGRREKEKNLQLASNSDQRASHLLGLRPTATKVTPKILTSPISKLDGNNISLICNPKKF